MGKHGVCKKHSMQFFRRLSVSETSGTRMATWLLSLGPKANSQNVLHCRCTFFGSCTNIIHLTKRSFSVTVRSCFIISLVVTGDGAGDGRGEDTKNLIGCDQKGPKEMY